MPTRPSIGTSCGVDFAVARAHRARRPAGARAGAAPHRVLRRLELGPTDTVGSMVVFEDGRRRDRTTAGSRSAGPWTGRLRIHGRDAPPPVHEAARGAAESPAAGRRSYRRLWSSSTAGGGSSAWPRRCSATSGCRSRTSGSRSASRRSTRPSGAAVDPKGLRGAVRAAAPTRRGASIRGHLPPTEAREAGPRVPARRRPRVGRLGRRRS